MKPYEHTFLFPITRTKCPHCHEVSNFGITEQVAYLFRFIGIGIGRDSEYMIICGSCGQKTYIQKKDFTSWRAMGHKYKSLTSGAITKEDFVSYTLDLDLPQLTDLLESSATWLCECGESNPPNFSDCWKCGASSDIEPTQSVDKPLNQNGERIFNNQAQQDTPVKP